MPSAQVVHCHFCYQEGLRIDRHVHSVQRPTGPGLKASKRTEEPWRSLDRLIRTGARTAERLGHAPRTRTQPSAAECHGLCKWSRVSSKVGIQIRGSMQISRERGGSETTVYVCLLFIRLEEVRQLSTSVYCLFDFLRSETLSTSVYCLLDFLLL